MSRHPQDAGESGGGKPIRARIDAHKFIAPDGSVLARWVDSALVNAADDLSAIEAAIRETSTGGAIACWSGSPDATGADLFPDDPSTWTPGAWAALDDVIGRLAPRLAERGLTLLVRPHHRHVVGDVPSVGRLVRTVRENGIERVGVILDVESMLAPSMREKNVGDHRRRIREALASITAFEIV